MSTPSADVGSPRIYTTLRDISIPVRLDVNPVLVLDYMHELCRSVHFYPGINQALANRHRRGGPQALVTVNPDLVDVVIHHYQLRDTFDIVITSWETGTEDKVELCRIALNRLGWASARGVVLIDNLTANVTSWISIGGQGYVFSDDETFVSDLANGRIPAVRPSDGPVDQHDV